MSGMANSMAVAGTQRRQRFSSTSRRLSGGQPDPNQPPDNNAPNGRVPAHKLNMPVKARTASTSRNIKPIPGTADSNSSSADTSATAAATTAGVEEKSRPYHEIEILGHEERRHPVENYVVYLIQVSPPDGSTAQNWTVKRQYNEFANLDRIIRKLPKTNEIAQMKIPSLPPKNISSDTAALDAILPLLESYLQKLLSQPDVWPIADLQRFFNPRTLNYDEIVTASRPRTNYDQPKTETPTAAASRPALKVDTNIQSSSNGPDSNMTSPISTTMNTPMTNMAPSAPATPMNTSQGGNLLEAKAMVSPLYERLTAKQASTPKKFDPLPMPYTPPNANRPNAITNPVPSHLTSSSSIMGNNSSNMNPAMPAIPAAASEAAAGRRVLMNPTKAKAAAVQDTKIELHAPVDRIDVATQDLVETGCQRQIKHPAIRAFWRIRLDTCYKLTHQELIDAIGHYLESTTTPPMTKVSIQTIKDGMKIMLERIDVSGDMTVTVFEINQWTKCIEPSLSFLAAIDVFIHMKAMKLIPAIKSSYHDQMIWGTNMYRKPVKDTVLSSLTSSDSWTVVYGPSLSGKSFRWLVGAHIVDEQQAVIWIDLNAVSTTQEMYSSVSSQLSLSVLALDDMISEFKVLLERSSYNNNNVAIILDHVDMNKQDVYYPLIKVIRRLKKTMKISVVIISSLESRPTLDEFAKEIKTPISGIHVQYIGPLPRDESHLLAQYYKVTDPTLVMEAARHLPGYIRYMRFLPLASLVAITRSPDSSITSSSRHRADGSVVNTNTRDMIIADNLSDQESKCAMSLYHPLLDNVIFNKAIAWNLCYDAVQRNIDQFHASLARLIEVGWLRLVADEGYIISPSSCLPTRASSSSSGIIIDEALQWSIYYRYWLHESIRMNDLLKSKDQLIACSYYDASRKHLEAFFHHLCSSPIWHNAFTTVIIHDMVSHLSSNISHIIEYRLVPNEGLQISKAILRVLCRGDDNGKLNDERYWRNDMKLKSVILRAIVNHAWDMYRTGQQTLAEENISHAIKFFGRDDEINFAYALNKLAIILRGLGKNEEALETHKKCYALRMSVFGEEHIDSAQSMNNIAIVLNALGRKDEAIKAHERCLSIRVSMLGKKHVAVGDSNFNLAGVYQSIGKNEEALECYKRARAAYIVTYGKKHVYVKELDSKMKSVFALVVQAREDAKAKEAAALALANANAEQEYYNMDDGIDNNISASPSVVEQPIPTSSSATSINRSNNTSTNSLNGNGSASNGKTSSSNASEKKLRY